MTIPMQEGLAATNKKPPDRVARSEGFFTKLQNQLLMCFYKAQYLRLLPFVPDFHVVNPSGELAYVPIGSE